MAGNLRRRSGAEAVYEVLREKIIAGELAPGERLQELRLAAMLDVSRTPVREALRLLIGERLVEPRPTGGFRVSPLYPADVRGIYEVRALLEGLLAREACERLTDVELGELRKLVQRMEALHDDDEAIVALGVEFHGLIERASANRWCLLSLQQLRGHIDRYRRLSLRAPGRADHAVEEHRAIYEALAAGDGARAEAEMREHVHHSGRSAVEALADEPVRG